MATGSSEGTILESPLSTSNSMAEDLSAQNRGAIAPDRRRSHIRRNWTWGLLLPLAVLCLLPSLLQAPNIYDEGIMLEGAVRVGHGEVPYRDFYAIYTPGGFYTLAGVFRLFGRSILVERIWDALVRLAVCLVVLAIGRRVLTKTASYFCCLLTAVVLQTCGYSGSQPEAMFFSLLGILLLLHSLPENRADWVFLSGTVTGIAALYRHNIGIYALVSVAVAVLLSWFQDRRSTQRRTTGAPQRLRPLLWYGGGACVAVGAPLLCLIRAVPLSDLRTELIEYPRIYIRFRSLPLPPVLPTLSFSTSSGTGYDWFLFYGPLTVYAISWFCLCGSLWNRGLAVEARGERFGWTVLTLLGSFLVITAVSRADRQHFALMTIPATILVPLLIASLQRGNGRAWGRVLLRASLATLAELYTVSQVGLYFLMLTGAVHRHASEKTTTLPRARGFYLDQNQEDAVRYVQQNVAEGQPIFVGNAQHHEVFVNDVLFYFLADRRPGVRDYHFDPGVTTTGAVQQEMIHDLERNQVAYIVLCSSPGYARGSGGEGRYDSGVTLLDDFLRREYRSVRSFGDYSIWKRR